jgi:hypothetical protein
MKFEALRPYKIRMVVDHIGLVCCMSPTRAIWSSGAFVASRDVAARRLAFCVAVVLADMKLPLSVSHDQGCVCARRRLQSRLFAPPLVGHRLIHSENDAIFTVVIFTMVILLRLPMV